jgi:transcriptional regulator with XRE-family HTH domain
MSETAPPISRKVKALRETAGLSQQALAMAAGISISVVSQLEQGTKTDPRLSTLQALAKALGVEVCTLANDDKSAPRRPRTRRKEG